MVRVPHRRHGRGALGVSALVAVLSLTGCATAGDPASGAAGGAILGGLAGALINPGGGDAAIPAAVGAVIGGAVGAGRARPHHDDAPRSPSPDDGYRPRADEGAPGVRP